ncbi:cryptochrome/photolyase family protein [Silicimonas sp. MF1-12-2]|uniref:cryptochrome/photolyase family protein n=1 Tax=Silicimonas sp. MF1-12-2 TaxID=3384793 RepID=UPI0039B4409C
MADPVIWWVRKDLRLGDNAALRAALDAKGPVVPVFILDEVFGGYAAAPLWRFGLGVAKLAETLEAMGSRLILRRGRATDVLLDLCRETGATAVRWSRAYDPEQVARDKSVKTALEGAGMDAKSLPGHLLFEPWAVKTKDGGFYKVYSPFWRAVRDTAVAAPLSRPDAIPAPKAWPESDTLGAWGLERAMERGARVVARHVCVGEKAALARLERFVRDRIEGYKARRDFPAEDATSKLSENLAWGEIGPRACWRAAMAAMAEGKSGAEHFLKELVWREFAYHLVWHTPHIVSGNWREGWDSFPWSEDEDAPEVLAWKQGRTGEPFVDAAMREMYVTGHMHNRARMIVASYLTKHLMCHWRIGQRWFEHCLIDWDPASNAMGWQWTAGSGPDAAPYFRVFNPATQLEKFDPEGTYRRRWIAEGEARPTETALSYFDAIPERWGLSSGRAYPKAVVDLAEGRARALAAYEARDF